MRQRIDSRVLFIVLLGVGLTKGATDVSVTTKISASPTPRSPSPPTPPPPAPRAPSTSVPRAPLSPSCALAPPTYLETLRVIPASLTDEETVQAVKDGVGAYRIGFVAFLELSELPKEVSCECGCAKTGALLWEIERNSMPVCAGGKGPSWLPGTKDRVDWALNGTFSVTKVVKFTVSTPVILVDGLKIQLRLPDRSGPISGLGLWDLCVGDCPDGGGGAFDQMVYDALKDMEQAASFSIFGGDNGYSRMMSLQDHSNLPMLWKKGFAVGSQAPVSFLTAAPSLMLLGNHEYQAGTGCSGGCPWEGEAAPYLAFMLTSGYAPWWTAGVNPCKCSSVACSLGNTHGGLAPPVDWRYTFGVYALGSVAVIAWDNRWSMTALLASDIKFQAAAASAIDGLAAVGLVDKVWFLSHWDGGGLGALEGVSESKEALQNYASQRMHRSLSWVGMAGHTHVATSKPNSCVTIGNNGKTNNGAHLASPSTLTFDPASRTTTVTNAGDTPGGPRFQWVAKPGHEPAVTYV